MEFTGEQIEYLERVIDMDGLDITEVKTNIKGNVWGYVEGNILRSVEGNVLGSVLGDVKGDVLGDVKGNVLGDVWGEVFGDVEVMSMVMSGVR